MIKLIDLLDTFSGFQCITITNLMGDTLVKGSVVDIYLDIVNNRKELHEMIVIEMFNNVMDDSIEISVK